MKENPEDPRTYKNSDLLAPEGFGEIIGGSERETDNGSDTRAAQGERARAWRTTSGTWT